MARATPANISGNPLSKAGYIIAYPLMVNTYFYCSTAMHGIR
jgi:hypothetical protein